jgi:NTP pyrophosphatase (non-canonical NTP hydrolase)
MMEEAIELAQAAGTDKAMIHKLVDFVYDRPVGEIGNELGGLGVTMLALANAAGFDADAAEAKEVRHILSKPLAHYTKRNAAKNAAGFDGIPKGCISIQSPHVMPGWGCCKCRVYNNVDRPVCKNCQHPRCGDAS